jgi:hypothetical protein
MDKWHARSGRAEDATHLLRMGKRTGATRDRSREKKPQEKVPKRCKFMAV